MFNLQPSAQAVVVVGSENDKFPIFLSVSAVTCFLQRELWGQSANPPPAAPQHMAK